MYIVLKRLGKLKKSVYYCLVHEGHSCLQKWSVKIIYLYEKCLKLLKAL